MADFDNVIEHIKHSDARISVLTKEMKEMEAEIKTTEQELEITRAKNRQILQDIELKKKCLEDKTNEMNILQQRSNVWSGLLKQKKKQLDDAEKELGDLTKSVFESRMKFHEKTNHFLNDCDFLVTRSQDIETAIKQREEVKTILGEIKALERDISSLDKHYQGLQREIQLIQDMEKTKQDLEREPEIGEEFLRIQMKIDACEEELEDTGNKSKSNKISHVENLCGIDNRSLIPCTRILLEIKDNPKKIEDGKASNSYSKQDFKNKQGTNLRKRSGQLLNQQVNKKRPGSFTPKVPSNLNIRYSPKTQD